MPNDYLSFGKLQTLVAKINLVIFIKLKLPEASKNISFTMISLYTLQLCIRK